MFYHEVTTVYYRDGCHRKCEGSQYGLIPSLVTMFDGFISPPQAVLQQG